MSIKFRAVPLHRALVSAVQAANTAALAATYTPAVLITARLVAAQALQTSAGSRLTQTVVPAPTGVAATALSDVSLRVTWANVKAPGFVNWKVYRSTDQTTWTLAATVTTAAATLTGLSPYVNYYTYVTQTTTPPTVESVPSATAQARTFAAWNPAALLPATLTVPKNSYYDFAPHLIGVPNFINDDVALPSGLVISGPPTDSTWRVKDNGTAVASTQTPGNIFRINSSAPIPTVYVDAAAPTGGNGTQGSPYKTIQAAVNAAAAGSLIEVAAGVYPEQVTVNKSLSFHGGGDFLADTWPVEISGAQTRTNGFLVNNVNVTIDGFKITFTRGNGIYVVGPGVTACEIENCWTYDTGTSGIGVWGVPFGTDPVPSNWLGVQNLLVHHNKVERPNNTFWGATGNNEGITIGNGVKTVSVYNNWVLGPVAADYVLATGGEGIDFKEGVEDGNIYNNLVSTQKNGIYLDAGRANTITGGYTRPPVMKNIHVYNNVVYSTNGHGITVTSEVRWADSATGTNGRKGGSIDGVQIDYNTVYGCSNSGILVYDYGLLSDPNFTPATVPLATNIQVVNNVCHGNNLVGNPGYSGIRHSHAWATNSLIKKNVATGNSNGVVVVAGNTVPTVTGNINADPLFTNAGALDFTPQAGSPCVNAGGDAAVNPATDYNNKVRTTPDIGAIER